MAAILYLHFGRCSQLPYSVAIKTCSLHQPPQNPALPGFILIEIKIVNSFRNYLIIGIQVVVQLKYTVYHKKERLQVLT